MKLYLASKHLKHPEELKKLVNKPISSVKAFLIVNAFDNYPEDRRQKHITELNNSLSATKYDFKSLDLREFSTEKENLKELLSDAQLLWVSGGNVFYLRYLFEKSGLSVLLADLLVNGLVYAGDSAGAAVLGPDMHGLDLLDDPREAPELLYRGLGLTSFITLPHWGSERYAEKIENSKKELEKYNNEIITISDDQAIIVDGDERKVVG